MDGQRAFVLVLVASGCAWILTALGPLSLLAPYPCGGAILWLALSRRFIAAGSVVVLSPFSPPAVSATLDYAQGEFTLLGVGPYDDDQFLNIHPTWRCRRTTLGCQVSVNEWLWAVAYDLVGVTWVALLGPMPGTYIGPYPTWGEVDAALTTAAKVPVAELGADRILLSSGSQIALAPGCGNALLEAADIIWTIASQAPPQELSRVSERLTAASVAGVVAIRVPEWNGDSDLTVLVDPESGLLIAVRSRNGSHELYRCALRLRTGDGRNPYLHR